MIEWIDAQGMETPYLSAITVAELRVVVALLPAYAALMAKARTAGLPIATADGYIAAIAVADRFAVATRDTSPFEAAGAAVINPWQGASNVAS